jgi:hypothetical protein
MAIANVFLLFSSEKGGFGTVQLRFAIGPSDGDRIVASRPFD